MYLYGLPKNYDFLMQSKRNIFFFKINIYYSEPRTVDEKKDTSNWIDVVYFGSSQAYFCTFLVIHSRNDNIENCHILFIIITLFSFSESHICLSKFIYNKTVLRNIS